MDTLAISIVSYNVRNFVLQCIDSIYKSDLTNIKLDIWVVDNASIDGSVQAIKEKYPNVNIIANEQNVGFGSANNQILNSISSTYCLFLNPDTIIQEDTLRKGLDLLKSNTDYGAVGVKMVDGNGSYLPESKRSLPTVFGALTKFTKLGSVFKKSTWFNQYYTNDLTGNKDEDVEVLCGAFMLCKSDLLKSLNGFDEDYFMYGEDIDLSKRILESDHKIRYTAKTKIVHFKGESSKKASFNYLHSFYNSMLIYIDKHYNSPFGKITKWVVKIGIIVLGLLRGLAEFGKQILHPLFDFFLIFILLDFVKNLWSQLYFGEADYYDDKLFFYNRILYAVIWVFSFWFWGWYDNERKFKSLFYGLLIGTVLILTTYALLPFEYRSSRALVLIGGVVALLVAVFTDLVNNSVLRLFINGNSHSSNKILIVGNKINAKRLQDLLNKQKSYQEIIGYISPEEHETFDSAYINTTKYLDEVVKSYKVQEIIFIHEDISSEKIIDLMTMADSKVNYKIASDGSIVGSNNQKNQGQIFDTYSTHNLSKAVYRRIKRLIDILFGFTSILTFPLLFWSKRFRYLFINSWYLITGKFTLVGYDVANNYKNLPNLKLGVIQLNKEISPKEYSPLILEDLNLWYSKFYSPFIDLEVFKNYLLLRNDKR